MKGIPAIYLGQIVEKKHFRAFIYGPNGQRRLVESWDEFEANMQTGVWFATKEEADEPAPVVEDEEPVSVDEKPKANKKPKPKSKPVEKNQSVEAEEDQADNVLEEDDTVFEVTDDFLPNGKK